MSEPQEPGMDCIVVGGCATGVLMRNVRTDAQWISLKRPDYIKPIAQSNQDVPEVRHEEDTYEVHVISLVNSAVPDRGNVFGIAVVEGKSLTWAFSELVKGHVMNVTMRLRAANLMEGNA